MTLSLFLCPKTTAQNLHIAPIQETADIFSIQVPTECDLSPVRNAYLFHKEGKGNSAPAEVHFELFQIILFHKDYFLCNKLCDSDRKHTYLLAKTPRLQQLYGLLPPTTPQIISPQKQ